MKRNILKTTGMLAIAVCLTLTATAGGDPVTVGGAPMYPTKNIIENAVNSKDHTTLVAAVKAAGLVETLSGKGPFTVFAPTNEAFNALPAGTVDGLLKPEAKGTLTKVLTYHVIAGKYDSDALAKDIKAGNGTAKLKTVGGSYLTFKMSGPKSITVTDENGGTAHISIANVYQSNGVIHVVDKVLMPKM
ncbi:MAG: fasciclin domain-containing protein [Bacteroidetes bacterium]|nr:fasciclin domain-containing protein [Bacteroidota bacterium]